jgi:hypothetical protein
MAIKYKHKQTKEIAEYDSVMGLFYVEGKVFKDTGYPIPISPLEIRNNQDWEYYEDDKETLQGKTKKNNK